MSGIGFWELIILALLGLIVLGPERLPRVASQIGGWLGQARRMTRVMRRQLEDELNFEKEFSNKKEHKPPVSKTSVDKTESAVSAPGYVQDAPAATDEHDDHYSAAHDADSVGLGVNDEPLDDHAEADAVELAAMTSTAADDADAPGSRSDGNPHPDSDTDIVADREPDGDSDKTPAA